MIRAAIFGIFLATGFFTAAQAQVGQIPTYVALPDNPVTPPPPPPPTGAVVSQIHNAPGWLPNHAYAPASGPFTRVNSGPGWSPAGGAWNPGQALNAYELTSEACTSGATMLTGSGSSISDGSCTWKYLSVTDYISITGWSSDNRPWAKGQYGFHDVVTSDAPLRAYMQVSDSCTSTVAPTGVGSAYNYEGEGNSLGIGIDGCQWVNFADVLYTSGKSYIPTQTYNSGTATVYVLTDYVGLLWNDRQYVAGQSGEKSPISIRNHNSYFGEGPGLNCENTPAGDNKWANCGYVVIAAAPGESFADRMKPTDPLQGYDPTKGVSILMNDGWRWPVAPDGLYVENNVNIIGLQIKAIHGSAVGDINGASNNHNTIQDCILEGGYNDTPWVIPAVVSVDTASAIVNSLLISHGYNGITFKYPGFVLNSTIINADGTGDVAIETGNRWVYRDTVVAGTAIFGFKHAGAAGGDYPPAFDPTSSHNVTDAPVGDSGLAVWAGSLPPGMPVATIPGTTYGSSFGAAFMAAGDYRPKPGGPIAGNGAPYGTFSLYCEEAHPDCAARRDYTFDTPDLLGTARPGSGGYDIGAFQKP